MAKAQAQTAQQGPPPGAYFRIPGVGARPRIVIETGPCPPKTKVTLAQGVSTPAGFKKFDTLDIDKSFLFQVAMSSKYTENTSKVIKPSPLFPANVVQQIQVQFESAYSTFRLPGWLAQVMQMYRSSFASSYRASADFQSGSNPFPGKALGANWSATAATLQMGTPTLAMNVTGTKQTYNLFFEIPVCMYFDLYYELSATGRPLGMPIPRALVSPQRMAASTRNVIPKVTYAPGFLSKNLLTAPAGIATTDTHSTFQTGSATASWWRTAWIPTDNMLTEPPGRMWQYTRDYIQYQPSGAHSFAIPLDDEVPGQGQIMSMVFGLWDPTLNSGYGEMAPFSKYTNVQLLLGSKIQLRTQTPAINQYEWAQTHSKVLPAGIMGWDLALTEDGKLTNEACLNTLVQNGAQIRVTLTSGYTPGPAATVYVGLEVLKKVGS